MKQNVKIEKESVAVEPSECDTKTFTCAFIALRRRRKARTIKRKKKQQHVSGFSEKKEKKKGCINFVSPFNVPSEVFVNSLQNVC